MGGFRAMAKPPSKTATMANSVITAIAMEIPRDGEKSNAMLGADFIDYCGLMRIGRLAVAEQPVPEFWILLLKQACKALSHRRRCCLVAILKPASEQLIEFTRASTATPAQSLEFGIHRQSDNGLRRDARP